MKLSPDRILSYSVWAGTECPPPDILFLCTQRGAPGFHSTEGKKLLSREHDEQVPSTCEWCCWCLQAWTLGLFGRESASSVQAKADQRWRHISGYQWWDEIKLGRYTLRLLIPWLIALVWCQRGKGYQKRVKDDERGENRRHHFLHICTWPHCISRVHETRPTHLKIA